MNSKSIQYKLRRWRIILFNWEYWSFNVVYFPVYFYWIWLSIKARSFFFFSTSNPSIENAGFIMESKKSIYDLMPSSFYPKTIFIPINTSTGVIKNLIAEKKLKFPLVAKPDIGERGNAVKKLYTIDEISAYQQKTKVDFLLQEWCTYENEAGIFYCKYPGEQNGFITGIVRKEFMTITGNGINSMEELLLQNDRYFLQHNTLLQQQPAALKKILAVNEPHVLVPYGNHCRGTKFVDDSHQIDAALTEAINNICNQIPGFDFGRLDLRFESWELLKKGKNFSIIELNGAGSEPTHIYDPEHSIFFAWKEIARHHTILYRIGKENKRIYKSQYLSCVEGVSLFRNKRKYDSLVNLNV
jgi:hypothetical protein